jgi:hypothetical protein
LIFSYKIASISLSTVKCSGLYSQLSAKASRVEVDVYAEKSLTGADLDIGVLRPAASEMKQLGSHLTQCIHLLLLESQPPHKTANLIF